MEFLLVFHDFSMSSYILSLHTSNNSMVIRSAALCVSRIFQIPLGPVKLLLNQVAFPNLS